MPDFFILAYDIINQFINNMKEKMQKNKSFDLSKKPTSQAKLPKIQSIKNLDKALQQQNNQSSIRSTGKNKNLSKSQSKNKNSFLMKLQPIDRKLKISTTNEQKKDPQKIEKRKTSQNNKNSAIDIRQSLKIKLPYNDEVQKVQPQEKKQTKQDLLRKLGVTTVGSDSRSEVSSRESIHPIIHQITNLISEETKQQIVHTKMYDKKTVGQLNPLWWCVVDTLLVSLQKLVKVKKTQEENPEKGKRQNRKVKEKKNESIEKSKRGEKAQKAQKEKEGQQQQVKEVKQQNKKIKTVKGKSLTNFKIAIDMVKVYCFLQPEIISNQKIILKYYEDLSHILLVLQVFYYEKVCLYLIGSLKKWNHPEEQFQIFNLATQILPILLEIRKLFIQIMAQAVENEADEKIKKPKYIAKEKKLIQISKYATVIKAELQVCYAGLGSPNRYKVFHFGNGSRQYNALAQLQCKWRNIIFTIPQAPFIPTPAIKSKKYLLVLEPLNILYKYNQKQQFLLIDPLAEYFLEELGRFFDIVFFTHVEKESSLLNFMGILDKLEVLGILDKAYLTYRQAKIVKELSKIGGGFQKKNMLVLDEKNNHRYYADCEQSLFLIDPNRTNIKVGRIKGKLVRIQNNDDEFLRKLVAKIVKVAQKDGKWSDLKQE